LGAGWPEYGSVRAGERLGQEGAAGIDAIAQAVPHVLLHADAVPGQLLADPSRVAR
jgi:hypothetical protein